MDARELVLQRLIPIPPAAAWRAWTDADLLPRWFAPKPWKTVAADLDVRVGGASRIVMQSPEGQDFPTVGVYLELVPGRRIVATDAYERAWVPSAKPFITMDINFEDAEGGCLYTARVLHWTEEDCRAHADMGFHDGWGKALDQLVEVMQQEAGTTDVYIPFPES